VAKNSTQPMNCKAQLDWIRLFAATLRGWRTG